MFRYEHPSLGRYGDIRLNVSYAEGAGAGNQLGSLFAPGLACCKYLGIILHWAQGYVNHI